MDYVEIAESTQSMLEDLAREQARMMTMFKDVSDNLRKMNAFAREQLKKEGYGAFTSIDVEPESIILEIPFEAETGDVVITEDGRKWKVCDIFYMNFTVQKDQKRVMKARLYHGY